MARTSSERYCMWQEYSVRWNPFSPTVDGVELSAEAWELAHKTRIEQDAIDTAAGRARAVTVVP